MEMVPDEIRKMIGDADKNLLVPIGDIRLTEDSDRLTLRIDAYWQTFKAEPLGEHVTVDKKLDTCGIEPFVRKFKATQEPKELFLGDIPRENVGYILAVNLEGTKLRENPTEEEKIAISNRAIEFCGFTIHPFGMPFLGQPSIKTPLTVQCLEGEATLQVYIFPR